MLAIRRVLHPTDFSDLSRPAFDVACALARDYGAELIVGHVVPLPPPAVVEGVMVEPEDDGLDAHAARLAEFAPDDPRVRMVRRLRRGDEAAEILKLAEEAGADLIVMGTHGRGGLSRLVMGSVAERVMRKARCPVLTVRTPVPTIPEPEPVLAAAGWVVGSWTE
jgi:nucleotide-binding universal stress UspA family protein